ncbi:hypothetical protein [[Clostridium] hylemonae]|uniref:Uncharacterized protein n=1 Tax=[Clostridium] hylemonae DSM 15053 TaxID=553973 RepID=C0BXA1_9FIRM|nr:hypothetical protein [[Clostridium] hylemonae]EEG75428.1 hypothetical protein CLOHYLEM_04438 [[Clostridium] hylemonae DSM 15053]QEK18047.1 hypothetical protein LAJLEIBI_02062 [[Clostridium] hylemonae DSM 15053]
MQKKSDSIIYETSGETDALIASYGGGQNEAKEMHKVTDTKGIKEDVDVIKAYELEIIKLKKGQEGLSKNDKGYKDKQDDIDKFRKKISEALEYLNERYANVSEWYSSMVNDVTGNFFLDLNSRFKN